MYRSPLSIAIGLALCSTSWQSIANDNVDVITVTAPTVKLAQAQATAIGHATAPDLAAWLDSAPGANVNRNGPVTGIAQYRGLFGDRVAVAVDGHTIIGAGPNAMDAPMSYVTPLMVQSVSLYRGITPVSAAIDSIGGSVAIEMRKASFSDSNHWQYKGAALGGLRFENSADTLASWVNVANREQALLLFANRQTGDSIEDGDNNLITPTQYDKIQAGIDYRLKHQGGQSGISYHYSDTQDSGTPALPMDIDFIKGHRVNLDGSFDWANWQIDWLVGYLDAEHAMDNYLLRNNPNNAKYRKNYATATSSDFKLHGQYKDAEQTWTLGLDGVLAEHDSTITNPNNAMFKVINFNQVEDNRISAFAQWQGQYDDNTYSVGVRVKHNSANAGEVAHHMAASNMMINNLVNAINSADRKVTDTNVDLAFNLQSIMTEQVKLYVGIGVKQRAPSYQERYLWMPMEATGGLADGKTYVGNINLDSETAYQLDLGLNYHNGNFYFAPHIYYQRIDDYIQGTPSDNPAVKMIANMMSNDPSPLVFSNVEAKLYGADLNWHYLLNPNWKLSGQAAYTRGERADIDDNLYRIAPANATVALGYIANRWQATLEVKGYRAQNKISDTNLEQETAGYGLVNLAVDFDISDALSLRGGIDNLLDRQYQSHLSGYYRPAATIGQPLNRVPGEGANYYLELDYRF